jgi:intron-binding protein aquarius
VALSRSRLGLYILGRREVFESCYEVQDAFKLLFERPTKLQLVVGEMYGGTKRLVDDEDVEGAEMAGVEHLGQYVFEMTQARIKQLKEGKGALPPQDTGADADSGDDGVVLDENEELLEDIEEEE